MRFSNFSGKQRKGQGNKANSFLCFQLRFKLCISIQHILSWVALIRGLPKESSLLSLSLSLSFLFFFLCWAAQVRLCAVPQRKCITSELHELLIISVFFSHLFSVYCYFVLFALTHLLWEVSLASSFFSWCAFFFFFLGLLSFFFLVSVYCYCFVLSYQAVQLRFLKAFELSMWLSLTIFFFVLLFLVFILIPRCVAVLLFFFYTFVSYVGQFCSLLKEREESSSKK